jgi:hypothetical protein
MPNRTARICTVQSTLKTSHRKDLAKLWHYWPIRSHLGCAKTFAVVGKAFAEANLSDAEGGVGAHHGQSTAPEAALLGLGPQPC